MVPPVRVQRTASRQGRRVKELGKDLALSVENLGEMLLACAELFVWRQAAREFSGVMLHAPPRIVRHSAMSPAGALQHHVSAFPERPRIPYGDSSAGNSDTCAGPMRSAERYDWLVIENVES